MKAVISFLRREFWYVAIYRDGNGRVYGSIFCSNYAIF